MHPFHKPVQKPIIIERNTDKLTAITIKDINNSANEIRDIAVKEANFPPYTPDNASVMLVFHTENGNFVVGGVRKNPALEKEPTNYPDQINSTIGGYLKDPTVSFKNCILESICSKIFLKTKLTKDMQGFEEQQILQDLCEIIINDEGWAKKVCVHTDKWSEGGLDHTMCVLTAIKHIECSYSDLEIINNALQTMVPLKIMEGSLNIKALTGYRLAALNPIIENSTITHLLSEKVKADIAYNKHKDQIVVTFNDLAVATLDKNKAFDEEVKPAKLAFSKYSIELK